VAKKRSRKVQVGATPTKLALIGVLGVILILVGYSQFGGFSEDVPPPTGESPVRRSPEVVRKEANRAPDQVVIAESTSGMSAKDLSKWRPPDLAAVIQYDPFALPASFPQPQPTAFEAALAQSGDQPTEPSLTGIASLKERTQQTQAELEALRHLGVQVVIRQHDQYVAMIGDRTIHVGDEINGFTVIAIDSDGVRVARELKP
jgi:hypothetical protein